MEKGMVYLQIMEVHTMTEARRIKKELARMSSDLLDLAIDAAEGGNEVLSMDIIEAEQVLWNVFEKMMNKEYAEV